MPPGRGGDAGPPHTLDPLTEGTIGEEKAAVVHRETAWMPESAGRRRVDAAVADRLEATRRLNRPVAPVGQPPIACPCERA